MTARAVKLRRAFDEHPVPDLELAQAIDGLRKALEDPRPSIPFRKVAARLRAKYIRPPKQKRR